MQLIRLLFTISWARIVAVFAAGLVSGVANTYLLTLIGSVLSPETHHGTTWQRFAITGSVALASSMLSQLLLIRLTQDAIYRLRAQLSSRVVSAPLEQLERLGVHRLLATVDRRRALAVARGDSPAQHLRRRGDHRGLLRGSGAGVRSDLRGHGDGDGAEHPWRGGVLATGASPLPRVPRERGRIAAVLPVGARRRQGAQAAPGPAAGLHGSSPARRSRRPARPECRCRITVFARARLRAGTSAAHHGRRLVRARQGARTAPRGHGHLHPRHDLLGDADAEFHAAHPRPTAR